MPWRRHNRNVTKEVFYDGTTIDGSRLEKAMGEIADGVNDVQIGNTKQRFVATQFVAGFNPQDRQATPAVHRSPWLLAKNDDTSGVVPDQAPFNRFRLKGTASPGVDHTNGVQYVWTRTFAFNRPCILHAVSCMLQNDGGADAARPYPGTYSPGVLPAYSFSGTPPIGAPASEETQDVFIVLDVMNPGSPEDAELTDVEYIRQRWVVNEEAFTLFEPSSTAADWNDIIPSYEAGLALATVRPLLGRVVEHRDLNIPIHERARVRLSVVVPKYQVTASSSWGDVPWYIQAWSTTLTVLEEVQSL